MRAIKTNTFREGTPIEHYLDNGATTAVYPEVAQTVSDILTQNYGNPSSLHAKGLESERILESARESLAGLLGCKPRELFFTSGGTESNNWAIAQGYALRARRAKTVITTGFEHASVLSAVKALEGQGAKVHIIDPDSDGTIDPAKLVNAVDSDTAMVSVMAVNNELGSIQNMQALTRAIKRKNPDTLVHCDAVQAFCKIPMDMLAWGVDMLTVSGHKVHAPKGIGALYIKSGVRLKPMLFGGSQQQSLRPGTENVAFAAAFAQAAEIMSKNRTDFVSHVRELNSYARRELQKLPGVIINSPQDALPHILNISVVGQRSETMLHLLAQRGVFVSSGSACAKGKASHVLTSMGMPRDQITGTLRVSFSEQNTIDDLNALCAGLKHAQETLIRKD